MKVAINNCYGGFGISGLAVKRMKELKSNFILKRTIPEFLKGWNLKSINSAKWEDIGGGFKEDMYSHITNGKFVWEWDCYRDGATRQELRTDPILIQVVNELGDKANSWAAEIRIVEIPDDIEWEISEYDGIEKIEEEHRSW